MCRVLQEMEKRISLHVAKYLVGLAEKVQDFKDSLSEAAKEKGTIVGIFGLGGAGKTTMAKELFNSKHRGYNASYFLFDVRESHTNSDLWSLQIQLLDDLFKEKQAFRNGDDGIARLKHRLGRERHLHFILVHDDIDHCWD
ncbi:hypothetical protein SUGI_0669130 [Cryptomeria japonica]|nr:hypothetical protein SUGI_0669130 [Cryptomeria japonica]